MKKRNYMFLIAIVAVVVFASGCASSDNTTSTSEPVKAAEPVKENKITDDMIKIQAGVWDTTPENAPLYGAGYPASLEMGDATYFVDENSYQPLIQYFGTGGTNKPFYAKIETRQVLFNDNAKVIVEVFDLEGNPLK